MLEEFVPLAYTIIHILQFLNIVFIHLEVTLQSSLNT